MVDNNASTNVMSEVTSLIRTWEDEHTQHNYDPIQTLTRLAEIIEIETENYLKMDPDPFDERHPSRADPDCKLGQILKALFRKDNFMNKLVNDYLRDTYYSRAGITGKDVNELNIAACRLMLDIMPGLETSVVFQPDMDALIHRLFKWSTNSVEPLQSYATGLLAAAIDLPDIPARFREQNVKLVPVLLQRLRRLQEASGFSKKSTANRPFAHFSSMRSPPLKSPESNAVKHSPAQSNKRPRENGILSPLQNSVTCHGEGDNACASVKNEESDCENEPKPKRLKTDSHSAAMQTTPPRAFLFSETSNSSWAELETFMIGTVQIFPPTIVTRQILILRYLAPLGEYQEFLSHAFEHNALDLILNYVNVRETKEARLAFEALRYLAGLLCHKKFSIEFIQCKGLEALLEVPRPSIAATGVSICLYYLGYSEEAMERVCLLPKIVVHSLVKYALWLLECSHDSGRCHAIMFFGLTFQFKIILEEFDAQDGLRKLHNVIATLSILLPDSDTGQLTEDQECAARQMVRHVCIAYRKYLEAHLYHKVESIRQLEMKPISPALPAQPSYKACKTSAEEMQQQIETLWQYMPFRAHWAPVDQLLKLGGITLLLKIIAFAYEWNYSGRAETVRSALDVLAIACVMPKVQFLFSEKVDLPEESVTVGVNIILGAAEGEIVADADVQKAALRVIVNCVCAPIHRVGGNVPIKFACPTSSPNRKVKFTSEELIQQMWDCVRANSGIMVLLQLMNVKTPITNADSLRTLACKALAGLTRSETVKQIVSKLPLFTSGQLQSLMRDPILQEKRQEHVNFQKYALELLERLSGKAKTGNDLDISLVNIHRANVVAQTKIQFNDRQLLQLIHQHLVSKGYIDTASMLVKEASLSHAITSVNNPQHPLKFRYSSTLHPTRTRLSFCSPLSRTLSSPNVLQDSPNTSAVNGMIPSTSTIKIIKKNQSQPSTPIHNSRLQKQIASEPHLRAPPAPLGVTEDLTPSPDQPKITLDSIITEYLTNQHALCKNPMSTCPQFNLFVPHKCPDPKPKITTSNNFAIRSARRAMGYQSKAMDRKFIHSRFCPVQTIRSTTEEGFFTCAKFMPCNRSLIVGDYNGDVRLFSLHSGNEENNFQAHDNYIVHLEPNRSGELVLTSTTWGRPLSALWNIRDFQLKIPFEYEEYVEFSKATQDRILGTKGEIATIYDVTTGQSIMSLVPQSSNQYTKNKATFSPHDDLVLSDGVLFDVVSGQQIHKLDKLNQTQSGVFHPNGLEIVSNTEVWDIRNYRLLKTVPTLNQCSVIFSPINSAIYAIALEQESDDGDATFDTSFKTVDAIDYTSIATIDVKKNIYDLAVNRYDTQIAVVENQGMYQSVQESFVRLYDVGRPRDDEDQDEDEEEGDDMDGTGSDDEGSDNEVLIQLGGEGDNENEDNANNENENQDGDDDDDSSSGSSSSDDVWSNGSDSSDEESIEEFFRGLLNS